MVGKEPYKVIDVFAGLGEGFAALGYGAGKSLFKLALSKAGFSANSLAQTFALLYEGAGIEGASSHSDTYFENDCWARQHQHCRCIFV